MLVGLFEGASTGEFVGTPALAVVGAFVVGDLTGTVAMGEFVGMLVNTTGRLVDVVGRVGDFTGETVGATETLPAGGSMGIAIGNCCIGMIVGVDSGISIGGCKG